ncbi:hypothetical protein [Streptomyces rubradiris]|uniref:Uncharacterized protein n=1 Tax=Streptomyces rubradiris TaxID=285531 RepID=A0ABQ3R565_STRRR|nr:hypothetical protein [Streptomyces rubradiris]GHH26820.1 hypothetical protein GCM10018792_67830 [Streptomyces rubradiris]GHI51011.1 hypothetical protein Srubr_08570 [Streptomyces rubradiris]
MDALLRHRSACEQCVDDHDLCPEGPTLHVHVRACGPVPRQTYPARYRGGVKQRDRPQQAK